jgi:hypothetical protein
VSDETTAGASSKKACFVISPIGADGSDVRKRADQILKHIISPVADIMGFEAIRADRISEPGLITAQVIQHIIEDELVIADLTGSNPNVFYELAIRHAIRKPLVQIIQKDEKIPFDVAGMRTIPVDHTDLDSVQEAKAEIEKQIRAVLKRKPEEIESPISLSVELQALRQSDNPEERSLGQFVSAIADLRTDIAGIEKRLSNPEGLLPPSYVAKVVEVSSRRGVPPELVHDFMFRIDRLERAIVEGKGGESGSKELLHEMARIRDMLMTMTRRLVPA